MKKKASIDTHILSTLMYVVRLCRCRMSSLLFWWWRGTEKNVEKKQSADFFSSASLWWTKVGGKIWENFFFHFCDVQIHPLSMNGLPCCMRDALRGRKWDGMTNEMNSFFSRVLKIFIFMKLFSGKKNWEKNCADEFWARFLQVGNFLI